MSKKNFEDFTYYFTVTFTWVVIALWVIMLFLEFIIHLIK
jgi:hypothetical protein